MFFLFIFSLSLLFFGLVVYMGLESKGNTWTPTRDQDWKYSQPSQSTCTCSNCSGIFIFFYYLAYVVLFGVMQWFNFCKSVLAIAENYSLFIFCYASATITTIWQYFVLHSVLWNKRDLVKFCYVIVPL